MKLCGGAHSNLVNEFSTKSISVSVNARCMLLISLPNCSPSGSHRSPISISLRESPAISTAEIISKEIQPDIQATLTRKHGRKACDDYSVFLFSGLQCEQHGGKVGQPTGPQSSFAPVLSLFGPQSELSG